MAEKEIGKEVSKQKQKYDRYKLAKEIIHQFGDKKFWNQYQQHTELTLLEKKVWNDMIQQTKKENPNAAQTEVHYLAKKKYEELLISQVDSLQIDLYIPSKS